MQSGGEWHEGETCSEWERSCGKLLRGATKFSLSSYGSGEEVNNEIKWTISFFMLSH